MVYGGRCSRTYGYGDGRFSSELVGCWVVGNGIARSGEDEEEQWMNRDGWRGTEEERR
jgi:hypothetical protein